MKIKRKICETREFLPIFEFCLVQNAGQKSAIIYYKRIIL